MTRLDITIDLLLLSILFIPITVGTALNQDGPDDSSMSDQLVLNVYIDNGGRALINGYVDDPGSLAFLNSSEYTYEDDNRQLYAITSALTSKSGDNWTVRFESVGGYNEYRIMLYLPANAKLRRIDRSLGLDYLVYAANESVIAEVHGHDLKDPVVNIEYILQLAKVPEADIDVVTGPDFRYPYTTIALFFLLAAGSGILIFLLRSRSASLKPVTRLDTHENTVDPTTSGPEQSYLSAQIKQQIDAGHPAISLNEDNEGRSKISKISEASVLDETRGAGIELTREISFVMDTLTDKEQSILRALLKRGGTMTQTEMRYELDISKSSLSGILTSMEKRKIITKQEKGRTNVIELSELFLNTQERS
jgi:DNA-binding MarR family transcriptional regulator